MTCLRPILACCLALFAAQAFPQQQETRYVPLCVGFYNIENLYDTIDGPNDDAEWLPTSPKQWNSQRYHRKIGKMAKVISEMGRDVHPDGLACMGFSEVETRGVLEDLVAAAPLAKRGYNVVHHDSPDRRGVDVGFIYNPKYFTLLSDKAYRLVDPDDSTFRSRDQLLVNGILDGDTVHFIVAHWPSRRGGEKASQSRRFLAAKLGRHIEDSLMAASPDARVIYMGDLNDDPTDPSIRRFLNTTGEKDEAKDGKLFDPMYALYQKGIGSLAWNDSWNLFDQIILSPALVTSTTGRYHYYGARVFNEPYLRQSEGNFAGYPFRTYVGDQYMDGYSDHFPVFVILVRNAE